MDIATELIRFLESLTVTQGDGAGESFNIMPWQRRFITRAFRKDHDAALSIARGNGKSTLIAGIAVAAVMGPLARPRGEIVIVASSFDQGRIVFEHALAFMRALGEDVEVSKKKDKRWRVMDNAHKAVIESLVTGAKIRCIGSDPKRMHGIAPSLVIADEPAQWLRNTADKAYAALRTSLGKIPGAKFIALGTRPANPEHWFELLLRSPLAYGQNHTAKEDDRDKKPFALKTIKAANPGYDYLPTLKARLKKEAREAKKDPALLAQWKSLRLNGGVDDVLQQHLLDPDTWKRIVATDLEPQATGPYVLGVDLAGGSAMSACAGYWPVTGRLEALAAFPGLPALADREVNDGVPGLYRKMAERGELLQVGEHAVDLAAYLQIVVGRFGQPAVIVGDRWRERELHQALNDAKIQRCEWIPRGQGYKDGSEDVSLFRRACNEGWVKPVPSLLLTAAMREARVMSDPARNQKLAKLSEGGRRQHHRDDAAAASIVAVAEGYREAKRRDWKVPA